MIQHGTAPFLECSSKGNKLLSAFVARIRSRGNQSIEDLYQAAKVFEDGSTGLNWRAAKGKRPVNTDEVRKLYGTLWDEYIGEHPELREVLLTATGLSDVFGQAGHACQATELWRIRDAMTKSLGCLERTDPDGYADFSGPPEGTVVTGTKIDVNAPAYLKAQGALANALLKQTVDIGRPLVDSDGCSHRLVAHNEDELVTQLTEDADGVFIVWDTATGACLRKDAGAVTLGNAPVNALVDDALSAATRVRPR